MKTHFSLKVLNSILFAACNTLALASWADSPIFILTPNVTAPTQLNAGQQGTAIYQITNNTNIVMNDIGVQGLPIGVTQIPNAGLQYCSAPFALSPQASCLLKVNINGGLATGVQGGPKICYTSTRPVYCSQPLAANQLNTQVASSAQPQSCSSNTANFNVELTQNLDASNATPGWGPARNCLTLSPSNPNLASCPTNDSAGITWQQQRVIAAADFWIKQKLNYCHHYVPDYATISSDRNAAGTAGGFCNPVADIYPGTPYYNQEARWNYSGTGSETINNWINNNSMWYGMDCSNYTAFLYDFAFGTLFDSDTGYQAGQIVGHSQDNDSPNEQGTKGVLSNPNAAGTLVCSNGTLDSQDALCAHSGGYISAIDSGGVLHENKYTADMLSTVLQAGDLLYIAGGGVTTSPTSSEVTHVVMWTGKQVGYGSNDINPSLIAPDDICPQSDWAPVVGSWVITDSHYQGADYRILTPCFYLHNLWGVRRVIPVAANGPEPVPNVNCQSHLS